MAKEVGAFYAKTHFSQLLQRVLAGEDIVVTRRGKRVMRMTAVDKTSAEQDAMNPYQAFLDFAKTCPIKNTSLKEMMDWKNEGRP